MGGKNWHKSRGGGGGGGNKGAGLSRMRGGFGGIMGTCDAGREKECSKELINVFSQVIEWLQETGEIKREELQPASASSSSSDVPSTCAVPSHAVPTEEADAPDGHKSIGSSLADEIRELKAEARASRGRGAGGDDAGIKPGGLVQKITSVDVGMKGVVMVQLMTPALCPVQLVRGLFRRTREEGASFTRHVVRVIPLRHIGFPDLGSLESCLGEGVLGEHFPRAAEVHRRKREKEAKLERGKENVDDVSVAATEDAESAEDAPSAKRQRVEEVPVPSEAAEAPSVAASSATLDGLPAGTPTQYCITFKNRNSNDGLRKLDCHNTVFRMMPGDVAKSNYKTPDSVLVIEAVRNVLGVSFVPGYPELLEFNIRKFQLQQQALRAAPAQNSSAVSDECAAATAADGVDGVSQSP